MSLGGDRSVAAKSSRAISVPRAPKPDPYKTMEASLPNQSELPRRRRKAPPTLSPDQAALEDRILREVERARIRVKCVDIATRLVQLAAYVSMVLMAFVAVDHWIVDLGSSGRWISATFLWGGAVAVVAYGWWRNRSAVSALFAAHMVEEAHPELKNSLTTFLELRRRRRTQPLVLEIVRSQTAGDLTDVDAVQAIDHGTLIRWGYLFAVLFTSFCLYGIMSPKSVPQSLLRLLSPGRSIERPASVAIDEVAPGDIEVRFGDPLRVEARIQGLNDGATPFVIVDSRDGVIQNRRLAMSARESGWVFTADVPDLGKVVEQDFEYRVEAGDAVSRPFAVRVVASPTIRVRETHLRYPPYMQRDAETRPNYANIEVPEGTYVTITAEANHDIRSGFLELDPRPLASPSSLSPRRSARIPLKVDSSRPRNATANFLARLNETRTKSLYREYLLRYVTTQEATNSDPLVHSLDVVPDVPPVVELLEPNDATDVAENGFFPVEVARAGSRFRPVATRIDLAKRSNLRQSRCIAAARNTCRFDASNLVRR